ncbi:hypothetical protein ACP70R_019940 [Stipagrostis hirtigluma subsp. patula]
MVQEVSFTLHKPKIFTEMSQPQCWCHTAAMFSAFECVHDGQGCCCAG